MKIRECAEIKKEFEIEQLERKLDTICLLYTSDAADEL